MLKLMNFRPSCKIVLLAVLALTVQTGFLVVPSFSQGRPSERPTAARTLTAKQIAAQSLPSVVLIVCDDKESDEKVIGSGFFVDKGVVVTNYHVIRGMKRGIVHVAVGPNKEKRNFRIARILGFDEEADLAILSVPSARGVDIPALEIVPGDPEVGETVYALGNPEGLVGTISPGIVSAGLRMKEKNARIQVTAPISEGSSGGPLVNEQGKVIGVMVSTLSGGQNLNFAVPSSLIKALVGRVEFPTSKVNDLDLVNQMSGSAPRDWEWGALSSGSAPGISTSQARCPEETTKVAKSLAETLRGLKGIQVVVERSSDENFSSQIVDMATAKTRIELPLLRNKVKVVRNSGFEPGGAYLYWNATCLDTGRGYACAYKLELNQNVRSDVDKTLMIIGVPTWSKAGIFTASYSNARTYYLETIESLVDEFLVDFIQANF